jgi:hypothetical protein
MDGPIRVEGRLPLEVCPAEDEQRASPFGVHLAFDHVRGVLIAHRGDCFPVATVLDFSPVDRRIREHHPKPRGRDAGAVRQPHRSEEPR